MLRSYFCLLLRIEISSLRLFVAFAHTCYAWPYRESIPGRSLSFLHLINTKRAILKQNRLFSLDWKFDWTPVCWSEGVQGWKLQQVGPLARPRDDPFRAHPLPYRCIMMGVVKSPESNDKGLDNRREIWSSYRERIVIRRERGPKIVCIRYTLGKNSFVWFKCLREENI